MAANLASSRSNGVVQLLLEGPRGRARRHQWLHVSVPSSLAIDCFPAAELGCGVVGLGLVILGDEYGEYEEGYEFGEESLLVCRCCMGCGRVLADDSYSTEVTFTKGADGSVRTLVLLSCLIVCFLVG